MIKKAKRGIAGAMTVLILALVPLYMEDFYFNLSMAKGHIYMLGDILLLLAALLLHGVSRVKKQSLGLPFNLLDRIMLFFFIVVLVSLAFAKDFLYALWGTKGFSVGACTLCILIGSYFVISRWYPENVWTWRIFYAVNGLIFGIGFLHSAGVDVFGAHEGILASQIFWYISTIGNVNWYVGYLCLIMPLAVVRYLQFGEGMVSGRRLLLTGHLLFLFLGLFNIVFCASDGIFLGLGFCAFFAIPYILEDRRRLALFCPLLTAYGLALLAVGHLPLFAAKRSTFSGLPALALRWPVGAALCLLGLAGSIALRRYFAMPEEKKEDPLLLWLKRGLLLCLSLLVLGYLGYTILHFSDAWGTGRGKTWRVSLEIYRDLPLIKKLFGIGPELLPYYYPDLTDGTRLAITVAHSEPIQLLLTTGLLGLISYLGIWGSVLGAGVKSFFGRGGKAGEAMLLLPLAAYFAQGLVNSATVTNAALCFWLLGLWRRRQDAGGAKGRDTSEISIRNWMTN